MEDKFAKKEACEYCGNQMDAKYRNKRFCSDKCRTYFNRENPKVKVINMNSNSEQKKPITDKPPKTNVTINTTKEVAPDPSNKGAYMKWLRDNG